MYHNKGRFITVTQSQNKHQLTEQKMYQNKGRFITVSNQSFFRVFLHQTLEQHLSGLSLFFCQEHVLVHDTPCESVCTLN